MPDRHPSTFDHGAMNDFEDAAFDTIADAEDFDADFDPDWEEDDTACRPDCRHCEALDLWITLGPRAASARPWWRKLLTWLWW